MKVINKDFCKACGSLAPKGTCPQGHDSAMTVDIKKVVRAEDGTRVLLSYNNTSLGNKFQTYACEHGTPVYTLKSSKESPFSIRLQSLDSPCPKAHEYGWEVYRIKGSILRCPQPANDDDYSPQGAAANLESRMGGINYKH